jgi:aldose 1-epimerase
MLSLRAGAAQATICPETGGAIAEWRVSGVSVFRPPAPGAVEAGSPRLLGCFPMMPYCNRIAHGRFSFHGTTVQLRRNFGDHPHSIHGNAWQRAWDVAEADETSTVLMLRHRPAGPDDSGWPFAYNAEQRVCLGPASLDVELRLRNADTAPMPAGFGLHPYFPRDRETQLGFTAARVWTTGPDHLPERAALPPPAWRFDQPRVPGDPPLDNVFAGWNGIARLSWPSRGLALTIQADPVFGHLVVFTPPGQDFLAVEPVSHMIDAVNRMDSVADHGLRILAPGESMAGRVKFVL